MDVANAAGASFRADLNNALLALVSLSSGASAPATTFAYQWWADTTNAVLKRRNAANSAWISVMDLASGLIIGTDVQAYDAQLSSYVPQNSKSAAYTTVLSDGEKHLLHPSADTTARTFTIDSNANVPYPIGTAITFVNQNGAGVLSIAITSDTLRLAGPGTTGTRSLAANGIATALKITSTEWIISGAGLS